MHFYPKYFSISSQILIDQAKKLGFSTKILSPEKNFFSISKNGKTWFFKNLKSEKTSSIALEIANDKVLTKKFLEAIGIETVAGNLLNPEEKMSKINFPVVLKPVSESHGTGVFTNIKTQKEFDEISKKLFRKYDQILIEEFINGIDLRILCIGGIAKSAIVRFPPFVIGNGESTIEQLIANENANENRGEGYSKKLSKILIDESVRSFLESKNKNLKTILSRNEKQFLSDRANTGIGGGFEQVYEKLTLKNKKFAENIAKKLNPHGFCAIDILCKNPAKNWNEQIWKVLECEIAPGLRSHPSDILDDWLNSF